MKCRYINMCLNIHEYTNYKGKHVAVRAVGEGFRQGSHEDSTLVGVTTRISQKRCRVMTAIHAVERQTMAAMPG